MKVFDSFNPVVPEIVSIEQREYDELYDWNWWEVRIVSGGIFRMAFSPAKTAEDIRYMLENPSALRGPIRIDEYEEV